MSPEQAATVTPGQAAYEEFCRLFPYESWGPWEGLAYPDKDDRPDWEKIAQAAIEAAPAIIKFDGKLSETDVAGLREKFAEAVRAGRPGVLADPDDLLIAAERARDEAIDERDRLTERVAGLVTEGNDLRWERDRYKTALERIAHGGDYAAWAIAADALSASTPAVVTAGTGHLTEKIRGLAIPDEES